MKYKEHQHRANELETPERDENADESRRAKSVGREDQSQLNARLARLALTDVGNAARLIARFGSDLRYCHSQKRWYIWDEQRWMPDSTKTVMLFAIKTAVAIYQEAASLPLVNMSAGSAWANFSVLDENDERREELIKHGLRTQSKSRLSAMVDMASVAPSLAFSLEGIDADGWLLNVQNGTIDLRAGRLRPHNPDDLLTRLAPLQYRRDATSPQWETFLSRVLPDPSLREYVQRAAGYTLSGDTREQCFFFFMAAVQTAKAYSPRH